MPQPSADDELRALCARLDGIGGVDTGTARPGDAARDELPSLEPPAHADIA